MPPKWFFNFFTPALPFPFPLSYSICCTSLFLLHFRNQVPSVQQRNLWSTHYAASCHFFPLPSQYSPQNSTLNVLSHPQSTASLYRNRTDCTRQIIKLRFPMSVLLDSRQENKTHHKVPASQMLHAYTNYHTVNPPGANDISHSFYGPLARFVSIASLSGVWKPLFNLAYYTNT